MRRPPPRSTPTDPFFPDSTLFRSLVLCRHPAAQALTPRGLRIESMARRQRRHLGVIAGLDRRVLQAAVARNSKFIDDAGQSALFFGCRKGSAEDRKSTRLNSSH